MHVRLNAIVLGLITGAVLVACQGTPATPGASASPGASPVVGPAVGTTPSPAAAPQAVLRLDGTEYPVGAYVSSKAEPFGVSTNISCVFGDKGKKDAAYISLSASFRGAVLPNPRTNADLNFFNLLIENAGSFKPLDPNAGRGNDSPNKVTVTSNGATLDITVKGKAHYASGDSNGPAVELVITGLPGPKK